MDTRPVRTSEELNWSAVEQYLRPRLGAALLIDAQAPFSVAQFPGGHSNLTYLIAFGDHEFVLRRPPFGAVAPKAHDMAREYHVLAAVNPVYELAPRPYLLCEDLDVIGAVFYLMERRRGVIVRTDEPPQIQNNPTSRRQASIAMINALAQLHLIDIEATGISALGKPLGFVERQVRGWTGRWERSKTTSLPEMDQLAAWLLANLPPDPGRPTIIHGDFKLDNVMFDSTDVGRLVAVFDWEMSSVGDPLVDLGILLCYWIYAANFPGPRGSVAGVTNNDGWFTRDELLALYSELTKIDLSLLHFYEIFALFKLAVVLQQIFFRYHRGQTDDPRFAELDRKVEWLARVAIPLMSQ